MYHTVVQLSYYLIYYFYYMKNLILLIIFFILISPIIVQAQNVSKDSVIDLQLLANTKINDLFKTSYWSHTNSNGCDYNCRVKTLDVDHQWIGENIYKNIGKNCNINEAFAAWELSPKHKANLDHKQDKSVLVSRQINNTCYIVLEVAFN